LTNAVGPEDSEARSLAAQILASGQWRTFNDVAERVGVSRVTFWRWRTRDTEFAKLVLAELALQRDPTAQDIELRILRYFDGLTAILEAPATREEFLLAAKLLPPREIVKVGQYVSGLLDRQKRVEVMVSGEVRHTHGYDHMSDEDVRAEVARRVRDLSLAGLAQPN
jgi:hypothetical protein